MSYSSSRSMKFVSSPEINFNVSQDLSMLPSYVLNMSDYIGADFSYNLSIVIMPSAFPYTAAAFQKLVFVSQDVLSNDFQKVRPMIGEAIASNWFG